MPCDVSDMSKCGKEDHFAKQRQYTTRQDKKYIHKVEHDMEYSDEEYCYSIREHPFNFKGGGGLWFFFGVKIFFFAAQQNFFSRQVVATLFFFYKNNNF